MSRTKKSPKGDLLEQLARERALRSAAEFRALQANSYLAAFLVQNGPTTVSVETVELLSGKPFSIIRSRDELGGVILDVDVEEVVGEPVDS